MKYIVVIDGMGFLVNMTEDQLHQMQEVIKSINFNKINVEAFIYPQQSLKFNDALTVINERKLDATRHYRFWKHNLYDKF